MQSNRLYRNSFKTNSSFSTLRLKVSNFEIQNVSFIMNSRSKAPPVFDKHIFSVAIYLREDGRGFITMKSAATGPYGTLLH